MLPGFRFLFSAVVLSMSVLVFGLGAAALLRAAHETFASTPSLHAPPETLFAQQGEATRPALSMLRVDAAVAEKAPDTPAAPAVAAPEQVAATPTPSEPERTAALQPADSPTPESAKPDTPVADSPPQDQAAPARSETASPQAAAPAAADETTIAATTPATETASPPSETAPAAEIAPVAEAAPAMTEPASAPSPAEAQTFSTTIATLGGPPVTIKPAAKAAGSKPDKDAAKKHDEAKRTHRPRRSVSRAQLAQTQQPVDPFGQPAAAPLRLRKPR